MQKEKVLEEISKICETVFNEPGINIAYSTSANDIEKWDSMTNLFLIDSIEKRYQIKFSLDEILNAKNIGDLCDIVIKKPNCV